MAKNYVENRNNDAVVQSVRGGTLRRILAELADVFVAFILAVTAYGLAFQNLFGFKRITNEMSDTFNEMTTILVDRHLSFRLQDGSVYLRDDFETQFYKYYLSKKTDAYKDDPKRDVLQQYYTGYRVENCAKLSQFQYNTEILGLPNELDGDNSSLFVYDLSAGDPLNSEPLFSDATQANLIAYLNGNTDSLDTTTTYKAVTDLFNKTYTSALDEVIKNDQQYLDLAYKMYMLTGKRAYLQSAAMIASYIVGSLITFLIIPLVKMNGLTLGKRVAKLEVDDRDASLAKWWQFLIRFFVETFEYCFIIPMIGIMGFGLSAFRMPLMDVFGATVEQSVFLLIGLLLSVASLIFMLVTPNKQSLHDLASMTFINTSDIKLIRDAEARREAESKKNEE